MRVVLDTNVLVAALRSRNGASFEVLSRVGKGQFEIAISVPLVLEYEDALTRHISNNAFTGDDVATVVDYVISVAVHQEIFFLWRPMLRDPGDDMVLEVAVAADCDAIVTHNRRDFDGSSRFGLRVFSPYTFLHIIRGIR